jgi:hypothetical protein
MPPPQGRRDGEAGPQHKRCRECRERRPLDRYFPSRFSLDGYGDRCRPCVFAEAARNREERERRRALAPVTAKPRRRRAAYR